MSAPKVAVKIVWWDGYTSSTHEQIEAELECGDTVSYEIAQTAPDPTVAVCQECARRKDPGMKGEA